MSALQDLFTDPNYENPLPIDPSLSVVEIDNPWELGPKEEVTVAPVVKVEEKPPARVMGWTASDGIRGILQYAANPLKRIPTGIHPIDKLIGGGVGIGEVMVVVGKSGSGKSIVGQNIMENNLDKPGIFFSFEMPMPMLITRSLAMWSNKTHDEVFNMVEHNKLDTGMLEAWGDEHHMHYFVTRTGFDLSSMSKSLVEAEQATGKRPAFAVIDYMELVSSGGDADAIETVTNVAQALKGWAKSERIAVIMLHQTNKSLLHGYPVDDDSARYGGFTEADVVVGVWRPHRWTPRNKGEQAMAPSTKDWLRSYYGINVIKNRPKIDLHEEGYLIPISPSGRVLTKPGVTPETVVPGGGSF